MALQTTTQIFVSGTPIHSYISLKLHQEISSHHTLELVCRKDVVERLSDELVGESKDYLGEIITINISSVNDLGGYKELEFKGVVTKVKATKGFESASGDLVAIIAESTSILSEDGNHYASFNDVSLSEILDTTFQGYNQGALETSFSPVMSDTIHYSVQHNQSAFSYARRLAAYYNEWFYYDGQKLIFGSPSTQETELSYGVDLQTFSVELKTIPNTFEYFTDDYIGDEVHKKNSAEVSTPTDGYLGFMNNKSQQLYNKNTQVYHHPYQDASLKSRFDRQVEQYTRSISLKQKIAIGSSDNPGVHLGEIISVAGYGSYRVTKVTHTNIEGGSYKNQFEAVQAGSNDYPLMDIQQFPKSEIQVAKVVDNADPDGLGRIKVQFAWQRQSGEMTPWLRLMTPHAGSNKGFHFIPEKNEEVIINFEGGNAEKPFVMGALYNGSARPDSWQTDANDIKAIKTRSGHTVELNDAQGKEKIIISDKNSNLIELDTANGSITISAPENLILRSKNLSFEVAEDMNVNVSGFKNENISKDHNLTALNLYHTADENMESKGKTMETNADKVNINSSKENLELNSSKQIVNNSNEKIKLF